jgi:hypothetical protein
MESQKYVRILTRITDKISYVPNGLIPKILHKLIQSVVELCNQIIRLRENILPESIPFNNGVRFTLCRVQ